MIMIMIMVMMIMIMIMIVTMTLAIIMAAIIINDCDTQSLFVLVNCVLLMFTYGSGQH